MPADTGAVDSCLHWIMSCDRNKMDWRCLGRGMVEHSRHWQLSWVLVHGALCNILVTLLYIWRGGIAHF